MSANGTKMTLLSRASAVSNPVMRINLHALKEAREGVGSWVLGLHFLVLEAD